MLLTTTALRYEQYTAPPKGLLDRDTFTPSATSWLPLPTKRDPPDVVAVLAVSCTLFMETCTSSKTYTAPPETAEFAEKAVEFTCSDDLSCTKIAPPKPSAVLLVNTQPVTEGAEPAITSRRRVPPSTTTRRTSRASPAAPTR